MFNTDTSFNIYLIRHGESEANIKKDILSGRSEEVKLTPKGRRQASRLGKKLKRHKTTFDDVYSSTLLRAYQTAEIVTSEINFPKDKIIQIEEIVEYSIGEWADLKRSEVYTPEILQAMDRIGPYFTPPKGESLIMLQKRVVNWFIEEILHNEKYNDKSTTIAIFCHGMVIKTLLHFIMGFNDRLIHKVHIDNCSISRVKFDHTGWSVRWVNLV